MSIEERSPSPSLGTEGEAIRSFARGKILVQESTLDALKTVRFSSPSSAVQSLVGNRMKNIACKIFQVHRINKALESGLRVLVSHCVEHLHHAVSNHNQVIVCKFRAHVSARIKVRTPELD